MDRTRGAHRAYRSDVNARSHPTMFAFGTPATSFARTMGWLFHVTGMAGACAVTCRSIAAQAAARAAGALNASARVIAALMAGTSSCDTFELPVVWITLPLNVGSRIVWPSGKSRSQPQPTQTLIFAAGRPQNLVKNVSGVAEPPLTLNPMLVNSRWTSWVASLSSGSFTPNRGS